MNKKSVVFMLSLVGLSLVSCNEDSNDLQTDNKTNSSNEVKARSGMGYQDYYMSNGDDDLGYNVTTDDCTDPNGESCTPIDWTIDRDTGLPIDVEAFVNSLDRSSSAMAFTNHLTLVNEIFPSPVVEGVLANYFEVKNVLNPKSLNHSFKIERIHDGVVIGIIVLKAK